MQNELFPDKNLLRTLQKKKKKKTFVLCFSVFVRIVIYIVYI